MSTAIILTPYGAQQLLKGMFTDGVFTRPADLHVALYNSLDMQSTTTPSGTTPVQTFDPVEVAAASYARVAVPNTAANWEINSEVLNNTVDVVFNNGQALPESWGNIHGIGVCDGPLNSGNLLFAYKFTGPHVRTLDAGMTAKVLAHGMAFGLLADLDPYIY